MKIPEANPVMARSNATAMMELPPPPKRGRVGAGVKNGYGRSNAEAKRNRLFAKARRMTPSRLAALADLPLSGGGGHNVNRLPDEA